MQSRFATSSNKSDDHVQLRCKSEAHAAPESAVLYRLLVLTHTRACAMLQSVHTARWLLHVLALLLAVCAVTNQASWSAIDVASHAASVHSASTATATTSSIATSRHSDTSIVNARSRVTFAPGRYCIVHEHPSGSTLRECHAYAYLLNHGASNTDAQRRDTITASTQVAIHAATPQDSAAIHDDISNDNNDNNEQPQPSTRSIDRVVASWCRIQSDGSWFVQGAQSMGCLVVLDTCLYTMVFWLLVSSLATVLSLASSLWPIAFARIESLTAFCSYVTALLGVFVTVEWWGYSTYFIDTAALQSLALAWRFGVAFQLVCGSVLLSLVAARITLHLAVRTRINYAQLHTAPTPRPDASADAAVTTSRHETAQRLDCHDGDADPLQCPPNYHV